MGLSHFLLLLLLPRQICNGSCTRTPAPALNFNPATVTDTWLRDNLYRDTAPVPIYQISGTETIYLPFINFVPRYA